jgi:hypothetical protein
MSIAKPYCKWAPVETLTLLDGRVVVVVRLGNACGTMSDAAQPEYSSDQSMVRANAQKDDVLMAVLLDRFSGLCTESAT